jgi:hypothetical protein
MHSFEETEGLQLHAPWWLKLHSRLLRRRWAVATLGILLVGVSLHSAAVGATLWTFGAAAVGYLALLWSLVADPVRNLRVAQLLRRLLPEAQLSQLAVLAVLWWLYQTMAIAYR